MRDEGWVVDWKTLNITLLEGVNIIGFCVWFAQVPWWQYRKMCIIQWESTKDDGFLRDRESLREKKGSEKDFLKVQQWVDEDWLTRTKHKNNMNYLTYNLWNGFIPFVFLVSFVLSRSLARSLWGVVCWLTCSLLCFSRMAFVHPLITRAEVVCLFSENMGYSGRDERFISWSQRSQVIRLGIAENGKKRWEF